MPKKVSYRMRFTSYSLDPVIGKYFAHARFYDSANGRMLSPDPIKRGLNAYRYCDNDPVNYEDSIGEIANIIGGALVGALVGSGVGIPAALATDFVAGTVGSAAEQWISTDKVSARKSITSGLTNAVSGAIYGNQIVFLFDVDSNQLLT